MRYIKEIMIVAVCLMVLSFCVCTGFGIYFMYREGVQEYEDLRTYVKETDEDDHTEGTDGSDGKQTVVDFKALKKINPDIVAWIRIPDTSIDYPVVQGNDDSYYLTHTFKKTEHVAGAIFLDSDNNADFSDAYVVCSTAEIYPDEDRHRKRCDSCSAGTWNKLCRSDYGCMDYEEDKVVGVLPVSE